VGFKEYKKYFFSFETISLSTIFAKAYTPLNRNNFKLNCMFLDFKLTRVEFYQQLMLCVCLLNAIDSSVSNCLIQLILTSLHQSFMEESEREGGVMRNSGSLSVRNRNGFY
jgi:hypothetical protein